MSTAQERLLSELNNIRKDHKYLYFARPIISSGSDKSERKSNIMQWVCGFPGPSTPLYSCSYFYMLLTFTDKYPFEPPAVKFTKKMFHPNIYDNGSVCLDVLQGRWKPSMNVMQIITAVQHLLEQPNLNSPANSVAGNLYAKNKIKYNNKVMTNIKEYHNIFPWSENNVWSGRI